VPRRALPATPFDGIQRFDHVAAGDIGDGRGAPDRVRAIAPLRHDETVPLDAFTGLPEKLATQDRPGLAAGAQPGERAIRDEVRDRGAECIGYAPPFGLDLAGNLPLAQHLKNGGHRGARP
jgi:hypothetical protein